MRRLTRKQREEARVAWHDDGNAFMCLGCGAVARRTRDNPYPRVPHKKGCALLEEGSL